MKLLQNLYTRISHDLAGTVGALYNGSELLKEYMDNETADLIFETTSDLKTKLMFFRQTFGRPNDTEDMTSEYLKTISDNIILIGKPQNQLQRSICMVLGDILPLGGKIQIFDNSIIATSDRLFWNSDWEKAFSGEIDLDSKYAPAQYAYSLCPHMRFDIKEDEIIFNF